MTTTREDATKRDLPSQVSAKEGQANGDGAKKIDPWHFGAHTVPPNLRAELSSIELPDAPAERRYKPQAAEPSEELKIPKRDFRRSVAIGLGALVVVMGGAAMMRCSMAQPDDVPLPSAQPAPEAERSVAPAPRSPATPAPEVNPQSTANPTAAPNAVSEKPPSKVRGSSNTEKTRQIASAPDSTKRLPEAAPASPATPASARSSSRIVPPED